MWSQERRLDRVCIWKTGLLTGRIVYSLVPVYGQSYHENSPLCEEILLYINFHTIFDWVDSFEHRKNGSDLGKCHTAQAVPKLYFPGQCRRKRTGFQYFALHSNWNKCCTNKTVKKKWEWNLCIKPKTINMVLPLNKPVMGIGSGNKLIFSWRVFTKA